MPDSSLDAFRARYSAAMAQHGAAAVACLGWSAERIAEHQTTRLRALIAHAKQHCPFHARRLADVDPARLTLADLPSLPVLTKDALMQNLDDALADRRLDRALLEATIEATGDTPAPLFGEYLVQATGGSSGQRGVFVNSAESAAEINCGVMRHTAAAMAEHGAAPGGLTIAMVAAASPIHATGVASTLSAGGSGPVRMVGVPATLPREELLSRLNALSPGALFGYATVIASLAGEQLAGRLSIAPRFINTTSETLTPELRARIREGFGVPITNVFGSTEGLMGASAPDDDVITFNSDTCIVELVDARGAPTPVGEPSDHLLVTNLANTVQPLIRYAIHDRFVQMPAAAEHGHLRARVEGRADAPLSFGEVEVHPLTLRTVLLKIPEVLDYQVRRVADGLEVKLLAEPGVDVAAVAARLREALMGAGVVEPRVSVERVDVLPRDDRTGKLRRFI